MLIIPAIDLYKGKVVRLVKGDPEKTTVYSDSPLEIALKWKAAGAKLLHLVDLSAAFGEGDHIGVIKEIIKKVDIDVELGGGIRDIVTCQRLLGLGVKRLIIGTKAKDDLFLTELLANVDPDRIAVGVDVLNSNLAVSGWKEQTDLKGADFIRYLWRRGIKWIIYTDISRDGTLTGPNLEQAKEFFAYPDVNFILSGGVSSLDDLKLVKSQLPQIYGVITGKAIYEGKFDLSEAISRG
ncbi:MAG: 1-(5-phosphoribosyl)-5-[(5-phosphoribosylamino)methylideneamino]imidazole-4-carboxamide isomerase [Candidatus Omnitrophica bacterium]|nr:1-(5-phosphoribosyl)-5-[(5-phosphoribosylamino)methylideneamino]imidazole-4-carboxamide isomerase [Candidatus Omnitrophota bacterium]